jgi:hypothetical protein
VEGYNNGLQPDKDLDGFEVGSDSLHSRVERKWIDFGIVGLS